MNTKLKCLLLDDELPGLTYLKMLCEQIPGLEVVKAYNNPELLIRDLPDIEFDLCILDIEMPGIDGLQVANLLKGKPVIFTTAYREYAAEAFDLDAVDYVQKPVKMERLQQAVKKAFQRIVPVEGKSRTFVQLNTSKGKSLVYFEQLQYISTSPVDSRDKLAVLSNGTTLTLKNITFDKLDNLLPSSAFARINKKEMIALRIVHVFSFDEITTSLRDQAGKPLCLSLSEQFRTGFLNKIQN